MSKPSEDFQMIILVMIIKIIGIIIPINFLF
jgi:hypothetical protein